MGLWFHKPTRVVKLKENHPNSDANSGADAMNQSNPDNNNKRGEEEK